MTGAILFPSHRLRPLVAAICLGAAGILSAPVFSGPALARGPDGIADVAERVIDAVVNISTSQTVEAKGGPSGGDRGAMPQLPPGSPFEEFFDDFFKNRRGGPGGGSKGGEAQPRKTNSLGSGFIVDTSGIVVTNNHVIADADEINIIMNDGTKIKAELVGVDKKTDLAVLKFKPSKPLVAVKFGDSDKLRLGEWVIAIGNPFSLGGTVTAGIVSARNRDINTGPYDSYIQTDASINRGNSGRPAVQPRRRSGRRQHADHLPTGGLDRHPFRVPSKTVVGVVDSLRQFGELRRGWSASASSRSPRKSPSLSIKPARGADRRRRGQGSGQTGRHRARRRRDQIRRQGHQGTEGPVARGGRHRGRQGGRRRHHPQGQGRDPQGHARSPAGRQGGADRGQDQGRAR
jgi:serine protease Do